jgi:hypothetical protein
MAQPNASGAMVAESNKNKEIKAANLLIRMWRTEWQFYLKKLAEKYMLTGPSIKYVKSIR